MKTKLRVLNPFRALRVKVTPDPTHAAELEKRMRSLSYTPTSSPFHRDRVQERKQ